MVHDAIGENLSVKPAVDAYELVRSLFILVAVRQVQLVPLSLELAVNIRAPAFRAWHITGFGFLHILLFIADRIMVDRSMGPRIGGIAPEPFLL